MQAGLLTERIYIQRLVVSRDTYGAEKRRWEDVCTVRARVSFSSGTQRVVNGETINTLIKKITIRNRKGVDPSMRILSDGQPYRILSIDSIRRDQSLTFSVELINE